MRVDLPALASRATSAPSEARDCSDWDFFDNALALKVASPQPAARRTSAVTMLTMPQRFGDADIAQTSCPPQEASETLGRRELGRVEVVGQPLEVESLCAAARGPAATDRAR
jgi:hypothetical protein